MNPNPHGMDVQFLRIYGRATPLPPVSESAKKTDADLSMFTVQIPEEYSDFLRRYAAYLTLLSPLTGEDLPEEGRWTRKSLSESIIKEQCDSIQHALEAMFAACGPLPDPKDKTAMQRYVARAYAWSEQRRAEHPPERKKK